MCWEIPKRRRDYKRHIVTCNYRCEPISYIADLTYLSGDWNLHRWGNSPIFFWRRLSSSCNIVLFFPGVLEYIFSLQKIHYTVHCSSTTTPRAYSVVRHPRKRKHSAEHAEFSCIIECMPTSTIEPNRTQSKFDWVRLLKIFLWEFDCVRVPNLVEPYRSIKFD